MMTRHKPTRRDLLWGAVAGTAGLALARSFEPWLAAQSANQNGVTRLADDLFIVAMPGEENVLVQTTGTDAVMVDGASAVTSEALLKTVAELPGGGPVHTLFNTHCHPEQVGSNEAVGRAGKSIIAHQNTRLWLTTDITRPWDGSKIMRLPKVAQPNKTFYDSGTLDVPAPGRAGGSPDSIRYGHIPDAAHTDGDLYVYFPRHNVLAVGDVASVAGWPLVDWTTGGWSGGILGGLQRILPLVNDSTRIVPSRGRVLTAADLKDQLAMFTAIHERLVTLLNKGRGPSEAVEARPTKEFDAQMGNGDEFVRRAFESLWGYLSPDA